MITNEGKGILAKYLVGQAPAFASFIAIGCGAKPVSSSHIFSSIELDEMKNKKSLDFEMFRVPVTSRGYVTENGVDKIVFTGELPTLERYEITEVGLWSAGSNPSANFNDSRPIFLFNENEAWQNVNTPGSVLNLTPYSQVLDLDGVLIPTEKAFLTNSDNPTFKDPNRSDRYEGSRFLNSLVVLRGDLSKIVTDPESGRLKIDSTSPGHLRLSAATLDFDKSSPKDEFRLAFSVINKDSNRTNIDPYDVKIIVEFADKDVMNDNEKQYARFETIISSEDEDGNPNPDVDFANQRYFVSVAKFEDLDRSPGFTWKIADIVKIYVTIQEKDPNTEVVSISDKYYVCLDALRLENTTNLNPIYGLTAYSVIKTIDSMPVVKISNSSNHIEFRFGLGVL
jgi:hypothetical protein